MVLDSRIIEVWQEKLVKEIFEMGRFTMKILGIFAIFIIFTIGCHNQSYKDSHRMLFRNGEIVCQKFGGPKGIVINDCCCLFPDRNEKDGTCSCETYQILVKFYNATYRKGNASSGTKIAIGGCAVFSGGNAIIGQEKPFMSIYLSDKELLHENECKDRPNSF